MNDGDIRMNDPGPIDSVATAGGQTVAKAIAQFLRTRGVDRVFGLLGGHIIPIWDEIAQLEIRLIDVRDERSAVHMAHAHAELTGALGVALVTAGPGLTNAITAIANAYVSRVPILVLTGCPPRPQIGKGALQELPQIDMVRPITRYAQTIIDPTSLQNDLDQAVASAYGEADDPGPVVLEFPTDVLRETLPSAPTTNDPGPATTPVWVPPNPDDIGRAIELLSAAKKPLVITGRGARGASAEICRLLEATDALYLDTQESRGLLPDDHRAQVNAVRGEAMRGADLVVLIGRRLDYQLAYGSPAVFENARFIRIGLHPSEVVDNRCCDVEIRF